MEIAQKKRSSPPFEHCIANFMVKGGVMAAFEGAFHLWD
jgi:hypothetical protein